MSEHEFSERIEQLKRIKQNAAEGAADKIGRAIKELEGFDDLRSLRDQVDSLSAVKGYLCTCDGLSAADQGEIENLCIALHAASTALEDARNSLRNI